MHFIIVDDLISDQNRLMEQIRSDCAAHGDAADFTCYESGEAFLEKYRPGCCDALFLDILMGGMRGTEAARAVRSQEPRLPIIFTTTEPDFALDSYEVHAMDYLVKPVDPRRVAWCLTQLREYLTPPPAFLEIRAVDGKGHSSLRKLPFDEVVYARSQDHNVTVRTLSGECCSRMTFREFLEMLPQAGRFCVCGRGVAVNLSMVDRIEDGVLRLRTGERLAFSRRRQAEVEDAFAEYLFARVRKGGWA